MKEANPKLIGVFVIGGIILAVGAIVIFSTQDFFTPERKFVAYFEQSINGLNVGAPVKFRGIPVGEVVEIDGIYDPETGGVIPRLTLKFLPESLVNARVEEGEYTLLPSLLKHGLRASLKSQSILTGQLYVALDFRPDTPERRLGGNKDEDPELPTLDSGLDEMMAKLKDLPLEEVLVRAAGALEAAEELLRNPKIAESLDSLPPLLADADQAVIDLRKFVNDDLSIVASEGTRTLMLASENLVGLEATLELLQKRLDRDDPLTREIVRTLRELGSASRSVRELADFLEEHPEALLKGKKN
jgi:paraquat-inducible protein B